jgi:tRNA A-37 threonylcarbamoyl transferase component Bud32
VSDLFTQDDELDALLRAVAETDRPSEDLSGQTLAGFVLEERLGEGGMGVVYKARDTTLNRTVALKLLRADKRDDADRRARFLREARAAAALDHPNIARVHAVSVDEHHGAVIALEYIEGQILADALPLAPAEAQRVATEVASALAAAHAAGVVHRDLKPHNVMLDTSGTVKLLDFGLARQLEGGETLTTVEGAIVGTPRYMSPEQARGEKVDARSDVFSFGAMLHELLTGKAAFEGESDLALLDAIRFKAPGKLDKHVPKRLRQVVARCLEKKPEHRFADGAALLYVLEGRGRAKRWLTRTAVASAAVLLLASCAAGVTVYRWTKIGGATPAWHDIEEMTKSYPLPARAAFRRVIQTWYGEDYESSVAAIATVAAFAPDDPFSNFVYALSQGDEDGVKRAIELASDEDRPFYEMASKVSASMRQYPVTYHPSWRSPHDYDDEIEALLENANYHWTLYLARRLNDRGRAIERLKKLVALDPSVVAPHYSLATFLSVERRGDEALKVVAAAREHHPRSTVLDIAEAVANGSLGRWDEMEVIAKRLVASKQKNAQFQGWGDAAREPASPRRP